MTSLASRGSRSGADPVLVSGPGQLITVVPHQLGFRPADSLVLLELSAPGPGGTRARLGVVLRVDLPLTDAPEDVLGAAAPALRAFAVGAAPDSKVVVLGYDPDADVTRGGELRAGERVAAALDLVPQLLAGLGREVFDVLLVTGERYRSLTCERSCCPSGGTPLPTPAEDRISAEVVGLGLSAAPDRASVLPRTTPVEADRRAAAAAARHRAVRRWTPGRRRELLAEWDGELDRRAVGAVTLPDAELCGRLLAGFEDVATRDAVLLGGVRGAGADRARAALVAGLEAPAAGEDVHTLVGRALAEEPDRSRCALAAALAVDVARHATGATAAGAWAVAAWSSWNAGDGVRAGGAAEEALRHDPAQSLAGLVLQLLLAGRPPRRV